MLKGLFKKLLKAKVGRVMMLSIAINIIRMARTQVLWPGYQLTPAEKNAMENVEQSLMHIRIRVIMGEAMHDELFTKVVDEI